MSYGCNDKKRTVSDIKKTAFLRQSFHSHYKISYKAILFVCVGTEKTSVSLCNSVNKYSELITQVTNCGISSTMLYGSDRAKG